MLSSFTSVKSPGPAPSPTPMTRSDQSAANPDDDGVAGATYRRRARKKIAPLVRRVPNGLIASWGGCILAYSVLGRGYTTRVVTNTEAMISSVRCMSKSRINPNIAPLFALFPVKALPKMATSFLIFLLISYLLPGPLVFFVHAARLLFLTGLAIHGLYSRVCQSVQLIHGELDQDIHRRRHDRAIPSSSSRRAWSWAQLAVARTPATKKHIR